MKRPMDALLVAVLFLVILPTRAAAQSPREAALRTASRFVDQSALAVIRIDVGRVDTDALFNDMAHTLSEVLRETDPDSLGTADEGIKRAKESSKAWRERFNAAGGRELYFVLVFNPVVERPVIGVATIGEEAKTEELIGVLNELPGRLGEGGRVVEGAVVTGDERLLEGKPLDEPGRLEEIERAFKRAGDAPVQVALIPAESIRRMIAEQIGELPEQLGGGPATIVSGGVVYGWGALSFPPGWSLKLVAESESEEAASRLAAALRKGVAAFADRVDLAEPGIGEVLKGAIEPRAEGNLVVVSAGREKFERVKRALVSPLMRARRAAARMIVANRMRQQVVGCVTYAGDMDGEWPADLRALVTKGYLTPDMLEDPSHPERTPAFAYIRPDDAALAKSDWSKHAVVYENYTEWPEDGAWIAFADGHVETVNDETEFKKALEYARRHAAK